MRRWVAPRWLPPLAVVAFAAAAIACAVGAVHAHAQAARVRHWPYAVGAVAAHPDDDPRGPGVVFYDDHDRRRVLWLAAGDVDDLPPGSIAAVAYAPRGGQAELRNLPRQRYTASVSLGAVSAAGAVACGWWWVRRERRRQES